jgi:hypothetical protein
VGGLLITVEKLTLSGVAAGKGAWRAVVDRWRGR